MIINESLTFPVPSDRVVLALQDLADQNKWQIQELTTSRIVAMIQPLPNVPHVTVTFKLKERQHPSSTDIEISAKSNFGLVYISRKHLVGMLGRITNSLSLRMQTESIAINPTVAVGQGQGLDSGGTITAQRDRVELLKDLKELYDSGVLSEEEFAAEKARILSE